MSEGLEILKELGAQKIHKETHISKEHIQAILHESFEGLQPVQFVGFISILEREYEIELDELKNKGINYFNEKKSTSTEPKKVFVVPKRQKNYTPVYIILAAVIFLSFIYYKFSYLDVENTDIDVVDNSKIENAKNSIKPVLEVKSDTNSSDSNETQSLDDLEKDSEKTEEKAPEIEKKEEQELSLKVLPKYKTWVGYIEIKTNKKYQNFYRKELSLDTSKDWLLLFGAGSIKIEVNGEVKKFTSKYNHRFKYVDGELVKITVDEFKSLNKGRKW